MYVHDEFGGMDDDEEKSQHMIRFCRREPNGCPNGGRIVCARCVW